MQAVNVLIMNYLVILLINAAMAVFSFLYYKEKIYKTVLYFWCGLFLNLVLQGLFQSSNLSTVLAYSSCFLVTILQLKVLTEATHMTFPTRGYILAGLCSVTTAILVSLFYDSFTLIALPVSVGIATVMLHAAWIALSRAKKIGDPIGVRIFSAILILHSFHMLDYPFLRQDEGFAALGFSIALILLVTYSIFLPTFILNSISRTYLRTVSELNAKQNEAHQQIKELLSLAHVGEMSFGFMHDMATPIQILNHYANALNSIQLTGSPNKREIDHYAKGIENAIQKVASLQKMFRSFLQKGTSREIAPVDVNQVVTEVIELFTPIAAKAEITLRSEIHLKDTKIKAFVGSIDRVLLNLIQNSINALLNSDRKEISVRVIESKDNQIAIQVRDTGPGIPEERRRSLWEKFGHSGTGQGDPSRSPRVAVGGSGFGLFQVKQLIEELHGSIELLDSSEKGTVFQITLPRGE